MSTPDDSPRPPAPRLPPAPAVDVDAVLARLNSARGWAPPQPTPWLYVGALRWAARKRGPVDRHQPLHGFLRGLYGAQEPEALAARGACVDAGLRVNGRQVALGGRPRSGRQVVQALRALWEPHLAAYERAVAAPRWLAALGETPLSPGPRGPHLVGAGFRQDSDALGAVVHRGRLRFRVRPAATSTLGACLGDPDAWAVAATVALYRPGLAAAVVWEAGRRAARRAEGRAVVGAREELRALLAALAERVRAAWKARRLVRREAPYERPEVVALGPVERGLWSELEALLWPPARSVGAAALAVEVARALRGERWELSERLPWVSPETRS